jgi:hypothetical protein
MGTRVDPMRFALFRAGYEPRHLGRWSLLVTHEALQRARAEGIQLSRHATRWPRTTDRERFRIESCGDG